jgi:hypothetical protein
VELANFLTSEGDIVHCDRWSRGIKVELANFLI